MSYEYWTKRVAEAQDDPFIVALRQGDIKVDGMTGLLANGPDVKMLQESDIEVAYVLAAKNGDTHLMHYLEMNELKLDDVKDYALVQAIPYNQETIKLLLLKGANPRAYGHAATRKLLAEFDITNFDLLVHFGGELDSMRHYYDYQNVITLIRSDNLNELKSLYTSTVKKHNCLALHLSAEMGKTRITQHLSNLVNGNEAEFIFNPRHTGSTTPPSPMDLAAENGHLDIVEYFYDKFNSEIHSYSNAIQLALKNGHVEVAEYLMEKKAFGSLDYYAKQAIRGGHLPSVRFLINTSDYQFSNLLLLQTLSLPTLEIFDEIVLSGSTQLMPMKDVIFIRQALIELYSFPRMNKLQHFFSRYHTYVDQAINTVQSKQMPNISLKNTLKVTILELMVRYNRWDVYTFSDFIKNVMSQDELNLVFSKACYSGKENIVKEMVENKELSADIKHLRFAVQGEQYDIIDYLVNRAGVDVTSNAGVVFQYCIVESKNFEMFKHLFGLVHDKKRLNVRELFMLIVQILTLKLINPDIDIDIDSRFWLIHLFLVENARDEFIRLMARDTYNINTIRSVAAQTKEIDPIIQLDKLFPNVPYEYETLKVAIQNFSNEIATYILLNDKFSGEKTLEQWTDLGTMCILQTDEKMISLLIDQFPQDKRQQLVADLVFLSVELASLEILQLLVQKKGGRLTPDLFENVKDDTILEYLVAQGIQPTKEVIAKLQTFAVVNSEMYFLVKLVEIYTLLDRDNAYRLLRMAANSERFRMFIFIVIKSGISLDSIERDIIDNPNNHIDDEFKRRYFFFKQYVLVSSRPEDLADFEDIWDTFNSF